MAGEPLRVVVLGAGGRLGSAIVAAWSADPALRVTGFGRAQANLLQPRVLDETLLPLEFDVLVNAAACTAVDDCEAQEQLAWQVNAAAPGHLARLCADKGARLVHFSTDYVFDGRTERPYTETDEPNPLSVYGRTKLLGEHKVLAASPRHLVVRLSWLFGPGRPAFPEWVLRQACTPEIRVVADKISCPTYSADVARWLRVLILRVPQAAGLFHLCNGPACSWHEWAAEILRQRALRVPLIPIALHELHGLTAARPRHSALSTAKFEALTGETCRPWQEALAEHLG